MHTEGKPYVIRTQPQDAPHLQLNDPKKYHLYVGPAITGGDASLAVATISFKDGRQGDLPDMVITVNGAGTYVFVNTPDGFKPQSEVTGNAAGTNDGIKGRILPAITMSQTLTQATTGTTYQEARSARGTITFYNAALSPQTIKARTLLTGGDGVQVVTDQAVTVPAVSYPTLGTALVSAHAVQPGPNGNINAGDIYGDCCLLNISAVNAPFTGGEGESTYQSVSKHDIDTVEGYLRTSLTQAVTAALSTQVHNSETLITPPTCQPSITADHQVGDKATHLQVTESLSCIGVTYDRASLEPLMRQVQTHAASRELIEHFRLAGDVHATIQAVTEGSTKGTYQLAVQSTALWVYQFSSASLSSLSANIAGKDTREATQLLLHTPGMEPGIPR